MHAPLSAPLDAKADLKRASGSAKNHRQVNEDGRLLDLIDP